MPALSLFFFLIERSVLMTLVFYIKVMLKKVTMQRTQQFSAFSISKELILVPRAYDPSGLRRESRALGATISGIRHR